MVEELKNGTTIPLRTIIVTSLIGGFLLIPVHELGHVIAHWISGTPAAMSYARDYLLVDAELTWLGIFGGPFLPLFISIIFVCIAFNLKKPPIYIFPIAVLGAIERLMLYVTGTFPSDERSLSRMANTSEGLFRWIFLTIEIALLILIIIRLRTMKKNLIQIIIIIAIPIASFILMALFGIYVIEKNFFPTQYSIQFG